MIDGLRSRVRGHDTRTTATGPGLGRRLARHGVSADMITLAGVALAALTGVLVAVGRLWPAVLSLTVGGLMDALDGAVAKAAGTSSPRGAFLDSVADRVADALVLAGVSWYLLGHGEPRLALLPFAVLAVSSVISYERAKAESLGFVAKGGLMERAERLILLGVGLGFPVVLVPVLWTLLALSSATAVGRFGRVWRQAGGAPAPTPVRTWRPARVESRWRAWRETGRVGETAVGTPRTRLSGRRSVAAKSGVRRASRLRAALASDAAKAPRQHRRRPVTSTRALRRRYDAEG